MAGIIETLLLTRLLATCLFILGTQGAILFRDSLNYRTSEKVE